MKFTIYANIFIALCAALFTLETYWVAAIPVNYWVCGFVFFSTIFTYNFQRVVKHHFRKGVLDTDSSDWQKWMFAHKPLIYILMLLGLVLTCISIFFFINAKIFIFLCIMGAISILYVSGISLKGKLRYLLTLREIPFLKIILIGIVWTLATVILPLITSKLTINYSHFIRFSLQRFFFFFAIAIPFDIRDMKYDKKIKLSTIPAYFGVKKARIIGITAITFSAGLTLCDLYFHFLNLRQTAALIISFILVAILVAYANENRNETYFSALVDGTMILQVVLFALFMYF